MWNIYNISVKENHPFIYYISNNNKMLINICDRKNPKPQVGESVWTKNGWIKVKNNTAVQSLRIPTWLINKEDIKDCFEEQIREMVKLYFEDEHYKKHNLFLFTKIRKIGYSDVGISLIDAKSNIKNRNKKMENYLERVIKLRIFS